MRRSLTFPALAAMAALAAAPIASVTLNAPRATAAAENDPPSEVAASQARLAWKLLERSLRGEDAAISPASLASAFWTLDLGADATMQAALLKALELGGPRAAALLDTAHATLAAAPADIFTSADQLVFPPQATPGRLLMAGLEKLGVNHIVADVSKPEGVKQVDDWVAEKTHDQIKQILGKPQPRPAFVALNALYFKAKWKEPFDPRATLASPFHAVDGSAAPTMLMWLRIGERAYRADRSFIAVDLPFANERYWLTVVTSNDGKPRSFKQFEPAASWLSGEGFEPKKGDLALPRFSLETNVDLLPALDKDLAEGAKSPTALAEFGANAKIEGILQRTKIEVEEQGATAAAATAVIVVTRAMVAEDTPLHMIVDKPYLFALRDRQSGLILAAGYVGKAPKAAAH